MRVKSKNEVTFTYGSIMQCYITVKPQHRLECRKTPNYATLNHGVVSFSITLADFDKYFEVVE